MTGTASAHHREGSGVFTVPNMNYRQHQQNQADERLAALALRARYLVRFASSRSPSGWSLGAVICS